MLLREFYDDAEPAVPAIEWKTQTPLVSAYARQSTWVRELILSNHDHYTAEDPRLHEEFLLDQIGKSMHLPECQDAIIRVAKDISYKRKTGNHTQQSPQFQNADPKYKNVWLVTFTSKPEWTETEAKLKIDKYRSVRMAKYPNCVWVEEHGTENGGYHQHVLVQTEGQMMHTGQNLKPTKYYDANINVKKVIPNKQNYQQTCKYMLKENAIQGNTQWMSSLTV